MAHVDNDAAAVKARADKTIRQFRNAEGDFSPRARLDSEEVHVSFLENGTSVHTLVCRYKDLSPEVARAAALYGVMTSVTNTIGAKGLTTQDMIETAEARLETILNGAWSAERQVGARTSDFVEALQRVFTADGKPLSEDQIAAVKKRLADETEGPTYRERLNSNPKVAAALAAIRSERAAARSAEAQAKAAAATDTSINDLV